MDALNRPAAADREAEREAGKAAFGVLIHAWLRATD